jgi:hypothetical protein
MGNTTNSPALGFHTVGGLLEILKQPGLKPENGILIQVVAENGDAWQVWGKFTAFLGGNQDMSLMTLHHHELKFMHPRFNLEQLEANYWILSKIMEDFEKGHNSVMVDIVKPLLRQLNDTLVELQKIESANQH